MNQASQKSAEQLKLNSESACEDTSSDHHQDQEWYALSKEKPLICIMGPTASGKTSLAIDLCQKLNGEVISVDSAMVFRDMDIGTAKPTADELAKAKHHLIDICDPIETFSAAEFRQRAMKLIKDLYLAGKWPILAGGTMLYFKTLLQGIAELPATQDDVRAQVAERLKAEGVNKLHQWLETIDPDSAARLHPNDPQRISRAIEVYLMSGVTLTEWHRRQSHVPFPLTNLQFAIAPAERSVLHERIAQRFDQMLIEGFEAEVKQLFDRGDLHADLPSIRSVGYRQMWSYLNGEHDLEEARYRGIVATRQLAKRQFTWLRSWSQLQWLDSLAEDNSAKVLKYLTLDTI